MPPIEQAEGPNTRVGNYLMRDAKRGAFWRRSGSICRSRRQPIAVSMTCSRAYVPWRDQVDSDAGDTACPNSFEKCKFREEIVEAKMSTILIIVLVFMLLGGGGYYGFRRRG